MIPRWTYLYRAIDQHDQVIDVWLSRKRDLTAAAAFFSRTLAFGTVPVEVTTDRAHGDRDYLGRDSEPCERR